DEGVCRERDQAGVDRRNRFHPAAFPSRCDTEAAFGMRASTLQAPTTGMSFTRGDRKWGSAMIKIAALALSCSLVTVGASFAQASEIKLLSAIALEPALAAIQPQFEKSSGDKVTAAYGTVGAVVDRVQKGEVADVVIASGPRIDELLKQGKVAAGS